jgi:S1-C subfamily serine protease
MRPPPHTQPESKLGRLTISFMIAVLITLAASITANSQRRRSAPSGPANPASAEEIAKKILPSVVLIVCEDGKGNKSIGSGFFVRAQGELMIATAYHVIRGMIRGTWRRVNARTNPSVIHSMLAYDEQSDLALLSLDPDEDLFDDFRNIRPLSLAATAAISPGQTLYALGNPEGLTGTISQGIVSAAPRQFKEGTRIQISAPISPGSSGGPVVNSAGEVIGIAESFWREGQNLNFAVPVSLLSKLLGQVNPFLTYSSNPLDPSVGVGPVNQESKPGQLAPTVEETAKWLTERLQGSSISSDGVYEEVTHLSFPSCSMNLTIKAYLPARGVVFQDYRVFLNLAEGVKLGHTKDGQPLVSLSFRRSISYRTTYNDSTRSSSKEMSTDTIGILIRDEELAVRSSKAFAHLIQLCGGGPKKEPF